jgi:hypothetical protein
VAERRLASGRSRTARTAADWCAAMREIGGSLNRSRSSRTAIKDRRGNELWATHAGMAARHSRFDVRLAALCQSLASTRLNAGSGMRGTVSI